MAPPRGTLTRVNAHQLATEVAANLQHIAEALECVAATLPPDRRATVERHVTELRRRKAAVMAELA